MDHADILVISPPRRPDWRHAVSPSHPFAEPVDSPPFSAAAACEQAGTSTAVLTLQNVYPGFNPDTDSPEIRQLLKDVAPRLVVFASDPLIASRSTATVYGMQVITELCAELPSRPAVGACGRLATTAPRAVLDAVAGLDFVVVGEADALLTDLTALILDKGVGGLADYPSVVTRAGGEPARVEPAVISNPDALPLPAWHLAAPSVELLQRHKAFPSRHVPFSLRTSFGCKFRCRFCAGVPHWTTYRTKSAERTAAEVDHLTAALGDVARLSFLEDEIATRHADHVKGFTTVLADRDIRLDGLYTHASLLTPAIAAMLTPITSKVFLGLDNASDTLLRQMGKGQRLETVLDAAEVARQAGLATHLEWIIGTPGETVDDLITSLHAICTLLATGIVASIGTYVYCPHPGTAYAEQAEYQMVIHEPFHMLESGGYPAASTPRLNRNQVFTAYLMSQLIITEIQQARARCGPAQQVAPPARAELRQLFAQIGDAS